jgi:hypothetical protein
MENGGNLAVAAPPSFLLLMLLLGSLVVLSPAGGGDICFVPFNENAFLFHPKYWGKLHCGGDAFSMPINYYY